MVDEYKGYYGENTKGSVFPSPFAFAMKAEFPEVEAISRVINSKNWQHEFRYNDHVFYENNSLYADPDIFKILTFEFYKGNQKTALLDPNSICLSAALAKKIFGNENPMGKTLLVNGIHDLTVKGIYNDIPANSDIRPNFIIPSSFMNGQSMGILQGGKYDQASWGFSNFNIYFLLKENADIDNLNKKYRTMLDKYTSKDYYSKTIYSSQPLTDFHLGSQLSPAGTMNDNLKNIFLFSSVAFIILLIACINYINMANNFYNI